MLPDLTSRQSPFDTYTPRFGVYSDHVVIDQLSITLNSIVLSFIDKRLISESPDYLDCVQDLRKEDYYLTDQGEKIWYTQKVTNTKLNVSSLKDGINSSKWSVLQNLRNIKIDEFYVAVIFGGGGG